MERRNKPTTTSTSSSVADFTDGWPPSSMPPEPSSPSPTTDFQVVFMYFFRYFNPEFVCQKYVVQLSPYTGVA